jgi:hypothetical protein
VKWIQQIALLSSYHIVMMYQRIFLLSVKLHCAETALLKYEQPSVYLPETKHVAVGTALDLEHRYVTKLRQCK